MEELKGYELKALLYAEKYGIIDYTVNDDNTMNYKEFWYTEGTYSITVNLDTMEEERTLIDKHCY